MHRSRSPVWVAAAAALALTGCGAMAVYTAPAKTASVQRTDSAIKADSLFWAVFHGGDYDSIPRVIQAETAAYLADPNDAVTAAHLGWAHYWRLAESARLATVPPTITDDAILARRYFQEAVALDPSDARYLGFLASAELSEGSIHKDEKLTRHGYYRLLDAIDAWPEFNLFTAGYMMSSADAASPRFKQGLEWQWKNLEVCMGRPLDRRNPVFTPLADASGKKRACVNSSIAPHNFEGFFLNFGDMLVKSGDWQTATQVYAMARLSPDYASWKFAPVLQSHIDQAEENVAVFNGRAAVRGAPGEKIMFASTHACMGCHQR